MVKKQEKIIITGGAGFIGGTLIRKLLNEKRYIVYNFDQLGYASDLSWVQQSEDYKLRHFFVKIDLRNKEKLAEVVKEIEPELIFHLAAESHVDRSIDSPEQFVKTNVLGTFSLLEASRIYLKKNNVIYKDMSFF